MNQIQVELTSPEFFYGVGDFVEGYNYIVQLPDNIQILEGSDILVNIIIHSEDESSIVEVTQEIPETFIYESDNHKYLPLNNTHYRLATTQRYYYIVQLYYTEA